MTAFAGRVLGLLLAASAGSALAEDLEHERCMGASGGVTVTMLDCIGAAHARVDEVLNAFWDRRFRELTGEGADLMREAQRQWIAYRDSTCAAEAAVSGEGSFSAVVLADCRLRITRERVEWLGKVFPPHENGQQLRLDR